MSNYLFCLILQSNTSFPRRLQHLENINIASSIYILDYSIFFEYFILKYFFLVDKWQKDQEIDKTKPVVSFPSNLRFILLPEFQKPLLSFRNTFADGKSRRNVVSHSARRAPQRKRE